MRQHIHIIFMPNIVTLTISVTMKVVLITPNATTITVGFHTTKILVLYVSGSNILPKQFKQILQVLIPSLAVWMPFTIVSSYLSFILTTIYPAPRLLYPHKYS